MFNIQGDEMEKMVLHDMTLTTNIVRVMARAREVILGIVVKTDWEMVRRTLGNCREEGTMRLQMVLVMGGNQPPDNIKTDLENKGVTIWDFLQLIKTGEG